MTTSRDLFGLPVDPNHGAKGRPRHIPTPELRQRVAQMHTAGQSQPKIAAAIGVTVPTLVLHYNAELRSSSQAWRRHYQTAKG